MRNLICSTGLVLALASASEARTLVEADDFELSLGGWAQAGYSVSTGGDAATSAGPYIGMARLNATVTFQPWGRGFVQVEGANGELVLLDAMAEVRPVDFLAFRLGKFKVPTSADYLIPGPKTAFVSRGLVVEEGFVQKRLLGVELEGRLEQAMWSGQLQLGLFSPAGAEAAALTDEVNQFLSARAAATFAEDWTVHVAYLGFVLGTNTPLAMGGRAVEFEHGVDVAMLFQRDGWSAHLEGFVALDHPGSTTPFAAQIMLLKSWPLKGDIAFEPALRYDIAETDAAGLRHKGTVGLNLYLVGDHLNLSLNQEVLHDGENTGYRTFVQAQAGF